MKKVLLIQPSSDYFPGSHGGAYPPFGLWLIGSALRKEGTEVEILDLRIQKVPLSEVIKKVRSYDFVGISCALDDYLQTEKVVKAIRKNDSNVKIIAGGPAPSIIPDFYLNNLPIDQVVAGEGEDVIQKIINGYPDKIVRSEKPAELICPDYSLIKIEDYWQVTMHGLKGPNGYIFTARGCPFSCDFCAPRYLGGYREKEIGTIEEEIIILKNKGAKSIYFGDATFGVNSERTLELCSMLEKYRLSWMCGTRVDCISSQRLIAMAKSGCRVIYMGLESSSQSILDGSGKGTTVERNLEAVQIVKSAGITACAWVLFGLPGDTDESVDATLEMIKKLRIRVTPGVFFPIPKTPLFEVAVKEKGITTGKLLREVMPMYKGITIIAKFMSKKSIALKIKYCGS